MAHTPPALLCNDNTRTCINVEGEQSKNKQSTRPAHTRTRAHAHDQGQHPVAVPAQPASESSVEIGVIDDARADYGGVLFSFSAGRCCAARLAAFFFRASSKLHT